MWSSEVRVHIYAITFVRWKLIIIIIIGSNYNLKFWLYIL